MAEKSCECQGLELFTAMIDLTLASLETPRDDPRASGFISHRGLSLAKKTYDHLLEQANKPGNESLHSEVATHLEKMRKGLGDYQGQGIIALEVVRDAIHKSEALQQLLMCGGPYKTDAERLPAAKAIAKIVHTFGTTDEDVHPSLKKLSIELGC